MQTSRPKKASPLGTEVLYVRMSAETRRRAEELASGGEPPRTLAQWVREAIADAVRRQERKR